jgi:hypothetical protein
MALSGGGAQAVARLLEVPGASRTVLEIVVPYSETAMVSFLGGKPDQLCSAAAARAMAMAAYMRACRSDSSDLPKAGVGCSASLATDRPKRGPHRIHLALQTAAVTVTWSLELLKDQRSRLEEEDLAGRLVLNTVARACNLKDQLELPLLPHERLNQDETVAPSSWQDLLAGRVEAVRLGTTGPQKPGTATVVLPGAFNPLHRGHRRMAQIGHQILGQRVEFEISILNVDKPPLDFFEIERRTGQFDPEHPVWVTRAPTFLEKSAQFPGASFLVGTDTLVRIADPRYYADNPAACRSALDQIASRGCRFLVFGRALGAGFTTIGDLDLPEPLPGICQQVPEDRFREDICSTEIRRQHQDGSPGL